MRKQKKIKFDLLNSLKVITTNQGGAMGYTGKIGDWDLTTAQIANEIAAKYVTYDLEIPEIQEHALIRLGGEILPDHTWEDFDEACAEQDPI